MTTDLSKIAIDVRELADRPAGRGRFIRSLLSAMTALRPTQEFALFADARTIQGVWQHAEQLHIAGSTCTWHWEVARMIQRRNDINAFIATRSPITPSLIGDKCVFIVYDLVFKEYGKYLNIKSRLTDLVFFGLALSKAKKVLTISRATEAEILAYYPSVQSKLSVIPMAADAIFAPRAANPAYLQKWGIDGSYILTVGTIEPRKNHANLISSYQMLSASLQRKYSLVVVGKKGWMYEGIEKMINARPAGGRIIFIEYVSDDDLVILYNHASLFVYPSFYEGFGLPVLEAMACGTPVVTSNVSSMPEAAGGNAILVDPRQQQDIRRAMELVLGNPQLARKLKSDGLAWNARFTWAMTAQKVYQEIDSFNRI